ncbi:MBL fold metallo-hydrolase [Sphingobium sp. 22B]|uniref:MBL fold metallo-hydrolase n=1 Tax=unclassified Sphingobium TaxID=2611147 RepID=UPI0007831A93|nr:MULTISPECIES: MBL fold metallo-hydrolase [unclassified Sphingobium]KXU31500.1 MBL fold metallo-hydrolase [Sphingobium sp. AM]KYC31154.1 MBL fold metallo-hydrolase [Sphingobium sp. 22B]OAP31155.1 MBL fold metallo-hydrolase [Sphingobium sp. 20006FA]
MAWHKALERARTIIGATGRGAAPKPAVTAFFDAPTNSVSYVVQDPVTKVAAIIDSVLGFDPVSGRTCRTGADAIVAHVEAEGLSVAWQLETHVHADHLSAAAYLRERLGGRCAIGSAVGAVDGFFAPLFGRADARAWFDHLFEDGDSFVIGGLQGLALHGPGHTPADLAYLIGDALFVGDTLFMPDYGTARADFPGGNAHLLYRSIRRLLALPDETRMFVGHDYLAPGRAEHHWETSVGAQRRDNVHVGGCIGEAAFVAMRQARDATLSLPRLMIPSVQVNLRGGQLPPADAEGVRYLKLPIDRL